MMRRALDLAYPQLEAGPVDYDRLATTADAFWVRWTDYGYWLGGGQPDVHYNDAQRELQARGRPAGPYMFVGGGVGRSARQQIDDWAKATVVQPTWFPMYDLEQTRITGQQLTDWVNEALQRMAEVWGLTPVLYIGPSKPAEWGLARPSVPHLLMVAQYPSSRPYRWADAAGWEARATGYYGGPDVPWGAGWDIWQAMSTAEIPGVPGNVDCSFVQDHVFDLHAASGSLGAAGTVEPGRPATINPPPSDEEDDMPAKLFRVDGDDHVYAVRFPYYIWVPDQDALWAWRQAGLVETAEPTVVPNRTMFRDLIEVGKAAAA